MTETNAELVELLRLLAHPSRLRLLEALVPGEECVCHLTVLLGRRQAYVSQQLAVLRRAGLVAERKEGLRVYYRLSDPRIEPILAACGKPRKASPFHLRIARCPCPRCAGAAHKEGVGIRRNSC